MEVSNGVRGGVVLWCEECKMWLEMPGLRTGGWVEAGLHCGAEGARKLPSSNMSQEFCG